MATEDQSSDSTTDETETVDQDNQTTDQQDTVETSDQSTEDQGQSQQDDQSSDQQAKDPAKQALLADLHKERKDRKEYQGKVTQLEAQVAELTTRAETADAVQAKYDRLEAFLQAVGGPLSRALDSRSFTQALFETDKDIQSIVAEWHQANPSATSAALGASPGQVQGTKKDMNALLRAAAN